MQLSEMLKLESLGADRFRGVGPRYPWGGLFGGQIMAQGLMAASDGVDEAFVLHSTHAYFIRRGDAAQPIDFEVERLRDGRSFLTRRVVARQRGEAILTLAASFHAETGEAERPLRKAPSAPAPESVRDSAWSDAFECHNLETTEPGRVRAWYRARLPADADPRTHVAALTFLSDDAPAEALMSAHPVQPASLRTLWMASLDHSVWFHRPPRADAFLLFDLECHALVHGRGLCMGHIYDQKGRHVATVNQEVLSRQRRDP